jgi:hypothetical protein
LNYIPDVKQYSGSKYIIGGFMKDKSVVDGTVQASICNGVSMGDAGEAHGHYRFTCLRVKQHMTQRFNKLKEAMERAVSEARHDVAERIHAVQMKMRYVAWADSFENTVMTLGKDALLTNALKGSGYTAACYFGLISSISYVSVPVAADTLGSHATWTEAGAANAPTFAARIAATFGTAGSGSLATSASSNFTMTGNGTVKGAFLCFNGATSAIANTTGTLYAAGLFSGDKIVITNDVIQVSYTATLT